MSDDNDKRAAQTAFMGAENIQELYQQIVSDGYVFMEGKSLTLQIAEDLFPEIEPPDIQREMGLEPER